MGNLKYEITYNISFCGGKVWYDKIMIVKNCEDKYDAETKLSKYLQKKYEGVLSIKIIKCVDKNPTNYNSKKDVGKLFNSIFGNSFNDDILKDNPFIT